MFLLWFVWVLSAYHKDGIVQTRFFRWLEQALTQGEQITEIDAADKLISLRKEMEGYLDESFAPISAYGENAALPHYSATPEQCSVLEPRGLYLLDSGAHYLDGTTDITRTIPLGPLTEDEAFDYTCVLQGMIALSMASFPRGTRGCQLDVLARMPLWKYNRNYGHGTGHGVGYLLSVHEGPHSIHWGRANTTPLEVGMITSNEPGFYLEGAFGVRLENLTAVKEVTTNSYGRFLRFETLLIMGLGLVAFIVDTFGGVMSAKIMNLFLKEKINPMIGAAGISAFPMSARVVHKLGLEEDNQNFLLMHSIGVNVSGQIASVIAGGLILALVKSMLGG